MRDRDVVLHGEQRGVAVLGHPRRGRRRGRAAGRPAARRGRSARRRRSGGVGRGRRPGREVLPDSGRCSRSRSTPRWAGAAGDVPVLLGLAADGAGEAEDGDGDDQPRRRACATGGWRRTGRAGRGCGSSRSPGSSGCRRPSRCAACGGLADDLSRACGAMQADRKRRVSGRRDAGDHSRSRGPVVFTEEPMTTIATAPAPTAVDGFEALRTAVAGRLVTPDRRGLPGRPHAVGRQRRPAARRRPRGRPRRRRRRRRSAGPRDHGVAVSAQPDRARAPDHPRRHPAAAHPRPRRHRDRPRPPDRERRRRGEVGRAVRRPRRHRA